MGFRQLSGAIGRTAASFLAMTLVPAIAFAWLGWRLIDMDRVTETQRVRERLDNAAAIVAAALDRRLTAVEEQLAAIANGAAPDPTTLSDDALIVRFDSNGVEAWPRHHLLYYPVAPPADEAPALAFEQGEAMEFRRQDYAGAVEAYRGIAKSSDARIRAGALVRAARNLRKLGRFEEALPVYDELGRLGPVSIGGMPAELLAILGRCDISAKLQPHSDRLQESKRLYAALDEARWILDRDTYWALFAERKCGLSADAEPAPANARRLAIAAAVDWFWEEWREKDRESVNWRGRESMALGGGSTLVVWRGGADNAAAFIAGPQYVETQWSLDWKAQNVDALLLDNAGHAFAGRTIPSGVPTGIPNAAVPNLPWTLSVASLNPAADFVEHAKRRRLLFAGLAMIALVMIVGGYFTSRATARELAVARIQSDFVSAVSHEFRTPLTSMRHLTERLAAGSVNSAERRSQYYSVLARDTERLHRLVESLLDFGRMEAGGRGYHFEEIDAAALVSRVVQEFQSPLEGGGRRVELRMNDAAAASATIRADADALALAIRNLIDNALKYSPESAAVHVELARESGRLAIKVRDEGIGIPRSEQKKIFRKFVRGAEAMALSIKGTGIGLAMVQHVVSAHGGEVAVESEPRRGSTFTILL